MGIPVVVQILLTFCLASGPHLALSSSAVNDQSRIQTIRQEYHSRMVRLNGTNQLTSQTIQCTGLILRPRTILTCMGCCLLNYNGSIQSEAYYPDNLMAFPHVDPTLQLATLNQADLVVIREDSEYGYTEMRVNGILPQSNLAYVELVNITVRRAPRCLLIGSQQDPITNPPELLNERCERTNYPAEVLCVKARESTTETPINGTILVCPIGRNYRIVGVGGEIVRSTGSVYEWLFFGATEMRFRHRGW